MSLNKKDNFHNVLHNYLDEKFEQIVEEESEEAKKRIRNRMRKEQDRLVLRLLDNYSIERIGSTLRIEIKHAYSKEEE